MKQITGILADVMTPANVHVLLCRCLAPILRARCPPWEWAHCGQVGALHSGHICMKRSAHANATCNSEESRGILMKQGVVVAGKESPKWSQGRGRQ